MAFELIYTSAPQGIRQGSSGFCVVACTKGMGAGLIATLENLSAYKPVYPHYDPNAWENPISCSHCVVSGGGGSYHVLSRICFNGLDYTKRSNKLASHVVLGESEMIALASGPAAPFFQAGLFREASWEIKTELYEHQAEILPSDLPAGKCSAWERVTGDAGYGGVPAEHFLSSPQGSVCVLFDPLRHKNLIELVQESLLLLPRDARWRVTFNTYFTTLPAGVSCNWRFLPAGLEAERAIRRLPGALVIDLTRQLPAAEGGKLVDLARTGAAPKPPAAERVPEFRRPWSPVSPAPRPKPAAVAPKSPAADRIPEFRRPSPASTREATSTPPWTGDFASDRAATSNRGSLIRAAVAVVLALLLLGGGFFLVHRFVASREYREMEAELLQKYSEYRKMINSLKKEAGIGTDPLPSADIADLLKRANDEDKEKLRQDIETRLQELTKNLDSLKQRKEKYDKFRDKWDFQLPEKVAKDFDKPYEDYKQEAERRGDPDKIADLEIGFDGFRHELETIWNHSKELQQAIKETENSLDELQTMLQKLDAAKEPSPHQPPPESEEPAGEKPATEPTEKKEEKPPEETAKEEEEEKIPLEFVWMYADQLSELAIGKPVSFPLAVDPGSELNGVSLGRPSKSEDLPEKEDPPRNEVRSSDDSGNDFTFNGRLEEGYRLTFVITEGRLPQQSKIYVKLQPEKYVYFYFEPGDKSGDKPVFSRLKFAGKNGLRPKWNDDGALQLTYEGRIEKIPTGNWQLALKCGEKLLSESVKLSDDLTRDGALTFVFPAEKKLTDQIKKVNELKDEVKVLNKIRDFISKNLEKSRKNLTGKEKELAKEAKKKKEEEKEKEEYKNSISNYLKLSDPKKAKKSEEKFQKARKKLIELILKNETAQELEEMFGKNGDIQQFDFKRVGSVEKDLESALNELSKMRDGILSGFKQPMEIVLKKKDGSLDVPQIKVDSIK